MQPVDIRRTRSVTRIPVSINESKSDTASSSRPVTTAENHLSVADINRSKGAVAGGRRLSLSSALAAVTLKEPLERQMDSSMETVFRRWDAETTSVAIAEGTPLVRGPTTPPMNGRTDNIADGPGGPGGPGGPAITRTKQRSMTASRCDEDRRPHPELLSVGGRSSGDVRNGRTISLERRHRAENYNNHNNNDNNDSRLSSGEYDIDSAAATRSHSETRDGTFPLPSSTRSSHGSDRCDVFHVEFDANGYRPEDISVHVTGSRLTVHGVRRENDDQEEAKMKKDIGGLRRTTTEFCRRIRLPDDVDRAGLTCVIVDGQVIIEAPRTVPCRRVADDSPESFRTTRADQASPLNTPTVLVGADGIVREMALSVEVGRLFRPDDVTVKVKNSTLTLTVVAERVERSPLTSSISSPRLAEKTINGRLSEVAAGGSWRRLNANLTWEFDLPGAVEMDTLKAGLTLDGLLKITATMKQQQQQQQ